MGTRKYSAVQLALALAILFALIHLGTEFLSSVQEAQTHGVDFSFSGFMIEWLRSTFENLQSEMWQLSLQFALLAGAFKKFRIVGYEEDNEDMKAQLERVERKLNDLSDMQTRRDARDVRFP